MMEAGYSMASTFSYTITAVDKVSAVVISLHRQDDGTNPQGATVSGAPECLLGQLARARPGQDRLRALATRGRRDGGRPPNDVDGADPRRHHWSECAGVAALTRSFGNAANEISSTSFSLGVSTKELQKWEGLAAWQGWLRIGGSGAQVRWAGFEIPSSVATTRRPRSCSSTASRHRLEEWLYRRRARPEDISRVAGGMHNAQYREKFLGVFGLQGMDALLGKAAAVASEAAGGAETRWTERRANPGWRALQHTAGPAGAIG